MSSARRRCTPTKIARMARVSAELGRRDALEAGRVWSHRGRGYRVVHHGDNGRTHRANVFRLAAQR